MSDETKYSVPALVAEPRGAGVGAPPRIGGLPSSGMAPGTPGAPGPAFVRTVPPVSVVKPPDGVDFLVYGYPTGVNAANTPQSVLAVGSGGTGAYNVPLGSVGFLRSLNLYVANLKTTSVVTFTLQQATTPLRGFNTIPAPPFVIPLWSGELGSDELFVTLEPGKLFDIVVNVGAADVNSYSVFAQAHGWIVPIAEAAASATGWAAP